MKNEIKILDEQKIQDKIYSIRDMQVMLDRDLAELYEVETKNLNRAVKRNIDRFPDNFMFQLTEKEFQSLELQKNSSKKNTDGNLRFQFGTSSSKHGGRRYFPYVFTEQGVAMLSGILKSEIAIKISVQIINTFIEMRKFISNNNKILQKIDNLELKNDEQKLINSKIDNKIEKIFEIIEAKEIRPSEGIFYKDQVYDAYQFVANLIKKATKSIILVDNYIDDAVLTLLSKRNEKCKAIIYTKRLSKEVKLDLEKHNKQYPAIKVKKLQDIHDRFLIIDKNEIYHNGASIKNLGEKLFAITKMDKRNLKILEILKGAKDLE